MLETLRLDEVNTSIEHPASKRIIAKRRYFKSLPLGKDFTVKES